jgi:hypothetical protein
MTYLIRLTLLTLFLCTLALGWLVSGCAAPADKPATASVAGVNNPAGPMVRGVNLNDPVQPVAHEGPIILSAAKNEWTSIAVEASQLPPLQGRRPLTVRLNALKSPTGEIAASNYSAFQILSLPVDMNRAGFVRHTGLTVATRQMPRALLPTPMVDGVVNLGFVRNPNDPANPDGRVGGPQAGSALIWIDIHIPPETAAGEYTAMVELGEADGKRPLFTTPVQLTVHNFVIPDERHLLMVTQIHWSTLTRLFPNDFEAVTDRLLNRNDERFARPIRVLDEMVVLAQANRAQVVIPRLQPTVKWPANQRPQIYWDDFDSVVTPWLTGEAFADRTPLGYWPLPQVNFLKRFDRQSQIEYWVEAARHFDQKDWLARAAVFVEKETPGRASASESISLSADAAQILRAHPRIRVITPLEEDQVQLATDDNPALVDPAMASRLMAAGKGLVFASPIQSWPNGVERPKQWLRTDLPGLVPYAGAGGDERDVRLWAWLAFLRFQANMILWEGGLPRQNNAAQPADPNELVWFYPGSWFGVEGLVPSIQLKWLRRAQQDYEYLWLAKERGEVTNALVMARLITKPVEIQPHQRPDPTYALMCGTTDQQAWQDVQRLVAKTILLREPGQAADPAQRIDLDLQTIQWIKPQERPHLLGRTTQWLRDLSTRGDWLELRLGLDIYNASDDTPDRNTLEWTNVPATSGWQIKPQPVTIPTLAPYHVRREVMDARFDLSLAGTADHSPVEITFTNGHTNERLPLKMTLPVSRSDRREGQLQIDGSLGDWDAADAIQLGPLVQMYNRDAVQHRELRLASTPAQIYSGWADENFYVAFKLSGIADVTLKSTRNFVDYQFGRAWGEDLCQLLIQPVYEDNSVGPVLHVVCKPSGTWVERKLDPRMHADPWQPFEGTGIRFASTIDGSDWRGEVAIPWEAINEAGKTRPRLLRFNFVQHKTATGESASWAGPIDFGRDDSFTGILSLTEPDTPGMGR